MHFSLGKLQMTSHFFRSRNYKVCPIPSAHSLNGLVTPSIGIPTKRTYSVVNYHSNKHLRMSVCQIVLGVTAGFVKAVVCTQRPYSKLAIPANSVLPENVSQVNERRSATFYLMI